jgi:hypothetical protein
MKAVIFGYINGEHCTLGSIKLRGQVITFSVNKDVQRKDLARRIMADIIKN